MIASALRDRERPAELAIAQSDERQIDRENQERQRNSEHVRDQHRNAGDAAVDEVARKQETMDSHPRRQDSQDNEQSIRELT